MSQVAGSFGWTLRVNAKQDLRGFDDLILTIVRPDTGATTTKKKSGAELVIGTIDVTDDEGNTLIAHEYIEYTVETGVFLVEGNYQIRLTAETTAPAKSLSSVEKSLKIEP